MSEQLQYWSHMLYLFFVQILSLDICSLGLDHGARCTCCKHKLRYKLWPTDTYAL